MGKERETSEEVCFILHYSIVYYVVYNTAFKLCETVKTCPNRITSINLCTNKQNISKVLLLSSNINMTGKQFGIQSSQTNSYDFVSLFVFMWCRHKSTAGRAKEWYT
jgi:hypothetical protein